MISGSIEVNQFDEIHLKLEMHLMHVLIFLTFF